VTRQDTIVSMIEATGFETVSSLAEALDVNVSTIRRDLEHLAEAGLVRRTHGGAIPIPQDEDTEEFLQDSPNRAEKRAIGPAMAERILDGQSVFIDSGSTCLEVARALDARRVTVVTHDLLVGLEILKKPSLNLVFVGGELLPNRTHMWGPTAIDQLDHIRVNTAVFGANSVMEDGIYASTGYSIELQQKVRSIASTAYFVADSTKFGRNALYKVLGIDAFTAGITDSLLSPISAAAYPIPLIRAEVSQG